MNESSSNISKQLDIKIPDNFTSGSSYLPIAQLNNINGQNTPAIGQYTQAAPSTGTFVLGSVNGSIQWIATQDCQQSP